MPGKKSSRKSVHRINSDYPDAEDNAYSQTPSTDSSLEDDTVPGTARNSTRVSQLVSPSESFTNSQQSQRSSIKGQSSSSATPNPEAIISQPRRILNSICRRLLDAVSYLLNAVGGIFSHGTGKNLNRRLTFPSTDSDPVIAEIHACRDIIYWTRDNHTRVFKRNPERFTVFEIKQDVAPEEEQRQKQKPSIPKSKETTPLGTTVYRQPARGICIGSQQIFGAVKVVLDYNRKRAFVQVISRKSEVYATYTINSITFLTTCTPCGVAWIGDTFKPEDEAPGSEKERKQSSFSGQRQGSHTESNQSFEIQKNQNHPPARRTDSEIQLDAVHYQDSVPTSETVTQKSVIKSVPLTPAPAIVQKGRAPHQVKSKRVEIESDRTSTSEQLRRAERELLKHIQGEQYNKEHPAAKKQMYGRDGSLAGKKQAPGRDSESGVSNSEEEISIDVVHVVFSNPMQVQRLKHIVATLKGALGCGECAESNFSCSSSSEVSSATVDQFSPVSNDLKNEMPLRAGYYNFPSNGLNFEGSQGLPQGVARHGGVAQRLYCHSTESPEQAFYRNCYSLHKDQQQNAAGKVLPIQNADSVQEQQNGAQGITNNVSQKPALNSQVEPGVSNGAQRIKNNVSQNRAPSSQVEPGVSNGAQLITNNVSQQPDPNSQVEPGVSNGAQLITNNVSQNRAPNSQVEPGVSNGAQRITNNVSQNRAPNYQVEPGVSNGAQLITNNVSQKPASISQVEPGVSNGAQLITNNVSQNRAPNSQVEPGVSNGAQRITNNVSQNRAPNYQVEPGVSNGAQLITNNVSQKPASISQVEPGVFNGAQRIINNVSQKPALNSQVEPGVSNGAQRITNNVSQNRASNYQVAPGVSNGAQRITNNVSQKPAPISQVEPGVSNGAQRITNNVSRKPALNSQVEPGVSNGAQHVVQVQHLQHDQNQVPSNNLYENNYSLEKQNLADVQKLQTGSIQNLHQVQNQPVFFSQSPPHELHTMPPICTIQNQPQQEYEIPDPRLTSYLNPGTVGNQMPWTFGNQMPSTFGNQMPVSGGNQIPRVLRKDHLSLFKNFGNGLSENNMRRIHRHVNPSSIRRHWSISHAKPCNTVQVCWLSESDE